MYCDCSYTNLAESILSIYDLLLIDRNYIDYREVVGAKVLRNCIMFEKFITLKTLTHFIVKL